MGATDICVDVTFNIDNRRCVISFEAGKMAQVFYVQMSQC